jgi:hypothetical protein
MGKNKHFVITCGEVEMATYCCGVGEIGEFYEETIGSKELKEDYNGDINEFIADNGLCTITEAISYNRYNSYPLVLGHIIIGGRYFGGKNTATFWRRVKVELIKSGFKPLGKPFINKSTNNKIQLMALYR